MKKWILILLTGFYFCSCSKEPLVLLYVIDGLQADAAGVAVANGAENLRFLMENGVTVREAYCTSPAPRMYLPDGTLPWGTSSSPNVAMHTGTHVFESRQMDDIFLSARKSGIKSVFAGGAINYQEFTTPDFCYAGSLADSVVVQHGIDHFRNEGTRLIRLHLQEIRKSWTGPSDRINPSSEYQKAILHTDILLGKIIEVFKNAGAWDETYIIIAGDHGMGITDESDHPPSVLSSWSTFMCFYGPGIKKGKSIPYAESPDIAIMINNFLDLEPLKGYLDKDMNDQLKGTTGTFLNNIFIGNPEVTDHPKMILRYLQSKNGKISDEYSEYRQAMLSFIKELDH